MTTNAPIILQANHLAVGYSQKTIVHDLDWKVMAGEFIAILGPNGAGKSTLLKTFLGALMPLQGELKVLNHNPHQDCVGIGYMPQQLLRPELQHLSARTLLSASAQAHQWGLPHLSSHQRESINIALQNVEAEDFADKPFMDCSGGQQRRIMLAQALLGNPKLLLLDEPLANLDFRQQEKFIEILVKLAREQHVAVMITTHDINPFIQAVSRVLYLANGHALSGTLASVLNSEKLTELYQTPMEVIHYQNRFLYSKVVHHPNLLSLG